MSSIQDIESAIEQLPHTQWREIRNWLDELIEDQQELSDEFKASIERGKNDIATGNIRRQP